MRTLDACSPRGVTRMLPLRYLEGVWLNRNHQMLSETELRISVFNSQIQLIKITIVNQLF